MQTEFTYYEEFFHVVIDTHKEIIKLEKEHQELQISLSKTKKIGNDITDLLAEKNDRIGRLTLIVIIFCASALEAYINDYAINCLSKNYLKTYLDKLDLLSKWIIIPRIVKGVQLDAGSKSFQDLSWLISLRNTLVHFKSRKVDISQIKESDFFWAEDATRAIETVRNLVNELKKIDETIYVDWITRKFEKYPYID